MLKREQGNDGKTMWVYYVLLDRRVKTDVHCFDEETEALEYMYAKLTNFSELDSEADACTAFYYFLRKQYWP
ncbi:MAG: hypothetical protein MJY58_04140 [Bacteroidaceae bacterium]|nr:hypothetical protein [Bacteroidaceae bacterium]